MQTNIFGKPGDGKSYSTIFFIGLFAVAQQRRWLTNIVGVNVSAINEYLNELVTRAAGDTVKPPLITRILRRVFFVTSATALDSTERRLLAVMRKHGTDSGVFDFTPFIKVVSEEDVKDNNFWYSPDWPETSIMQPGDCVTIDEARRYFGADIKVPERTIMSILKHRHYVSAAGQSIDLYFIAQQPGHLKREVGSNAQFTHVARRFLSAGRMKAKKFRLDFYEGAVGATEIKKRAFYDGVEEKLNPRIFRLYKSFEGETGFESTNNVVTVWSKKVIGIPVFPVLVPLGILAVILGVSFMVSFFTGGGASLIPKAKTAAKPTAAAKVTVPAGSAIPAAVVPAIPAVNDGGYRLVGFYTIGVQTYGVIADAERRTRYITDFRFTGSGPVVEIEWHGMTIGYWTGNPAKLPQLMEKSNAPGTLFNH